jgi:hypothetical protein
MRGLKPKGKGEAVRARSVAGDDKQAPIEFAFLFANNGRRRSPL